MRGQTRIPVFFRSGLRATFFLHTKKEGKDVPRGEPLGAPGNFVDFLFRKIDLNAATLSTDIKRAAAQGLELLSFFGPAPNRTPGAPGPLVV